MKADKRNCATSTKQYITLNTLCVCVCVLSSSCLGLLEEDILHKKLGEDKDDSQG